MYLFCDIDGVLIPFPSADGTIPATHYPAHVVPAGHGQPVRIWLNPAHGPLLADLIADTGLEPVWCTSWRADASRLIGRRLGLPAWPHVNLPHLPLTTSHPDGYLWKRDYLAAHASHQPLAWIDDDFTPADRDWADTRTIAGHPTLLIQPDPRTGFVAIKAALELAMDERRTGEADYRRPTLQARDENPRRPGRPIEPFGLTIAEARSLVNENEAVGRSDRPALGLRVRRYVNTGGQTTKLPSELNPPARVERLRRSAVRLPDEDLADLIDALTKERQRRQRPTS